MKMRLLSLTAAAFCMSAHAAEKDMPSVAPESVGVDSAPLVRMSEWIRADNMDVRSLVIVKDGKIVFERYGDGLTRDNNYELYSVTKTITSLLVGVLEGEGKLSPSTKAAPLIAKARPDLAAQLADKQSIELRHLMSMSSGLSYQTREGTDPLYYGAPDRLRVAVTAKAAKTPGTDFDYIDVNPVLVGTAVSVAAHEREDRFAQKKLFEPLGMSHYRWTGVDETGAVAGGWGLRLRAVDMAKIGMLVLDHGRWQGRQIVPRTWITQMTSPGVAPYFGYYWWINNIVQKEPEFDAMGFKGKFITVLPERNTVIVMTSIMSVAGGLRDAKNLQTFRQMVNDYAIPALDNAHHARPSAQRRATLRHELALSAQTKGMPGAQVDPTDLPGL